MSESREEQAFRAAFALASETYQSKELQMEPTAAPRRRSRWPVIAAAAALVIGGSGVAALTLADGDDQDRGPAEPTPVATAGGELPVPAEGWRWESRYDLAVQVPDDWGYGRAPGSDWCASRGGEAADRLPYVDPWASRGGVLSIGCFQSHGVVPEFGPAPQRLWQTHVELAPDERSWNGVSGGLGGPIQPDQVDGTYRHDGWTRVVTRIGMATLSVLYDEAHSEQAERIIASARQIERVNQDGCPVTSPIQVPGEEYPRPDRPFDVDELSGVETIAVCQYQQAPPDVPALLASHTLAGNEARSVLRAIKAAPAGSGPNSPGNCLHENQFDQALVLRLGSDRELYVFNDSCVGNGFDDGTGRHQLSPESCGPLYVDPVRSFGGSSAPFRACFPDR